MADACTCERPYGVDLLDRCRACGKILDDAAVREREEETIRRVLAERRAAASLAGETEQTFF